LILGAVLIVMNALVISVLERSGEIGSMRALGASRGFIRSLFVLETMILTVLAACVGVAFGAAFCAFVSGTGIPLDNPLLASLFGGKVVRPRAETGAALFHVAGAALIGSLAWIYPVSIALKIQPVHAMTEK
jgi:putative ABC transport system permease protein